MEHAGSYGQPLHVCDPSPPIHTHPFTPNPRFDRATAWLAAYTRSFLSPTQDGPPSAWSADACAPTTCSGAAGQCFISPLCVGPDGACRGEPAAADTACDDGDGKTADEKCDGAGTCVGAAAVLKAALVRCVEDDPTGGCECAGTSCSEDPRFRGKIGTWDVSGVTDMTVLFYTYGQFNQDISAWDTSSVTTMYGM